MIDAFKYIYKAYQARVQFAQDKQLDPAKLDSIDWAFTPDDIMCRDEDATCQDEVISDDIFGFVSALETKFKDEGKVLVDEDIKDMMNALFHACLPSEEKHRFFNIFHILEKRFDIEVDEVANRDELRMVFFTFLLEMSNIDCVTHEIKAQFADDLTKIRIILANLCKHLCYGQRYASALWFYANAAMIAFSREHYIPGIAAYLGVLYASKPELMKKTEGDRYLDLMFEVAQSDDYLRCIAAGLYLKGAKALEPDLEKFLALSEKPVNKPNLIIAKKQKAEKEQLLVWFHFLGILFGEDILKTDMVDFFLESSSMPLEKIVPNEEFVSKYLKCAERAPLSTAILAVPTFNLIAYSFKYFLERRKAKGLGQVLDISEAMAYLKSATKGEYLYDLADLALSLGNDAYGFTGYEVKDLEKLLKGAKKSNEPELRIFVALAYLMGFVLNQDYKMVAVALKKNVSPALWVMLYTAMSCEELSSKKVDTAELHSLLKPLIAYPGPETLFTSSEPYPEKSHYDTDYAFVRSLYYTEPELVEMCLELDNSKYISNVLKVLYYCKSKQEMHHKLECFLNIKKSPFDKENVATLFLKGKSLLTLDPVEHLRKDAFKYNEDFKLKPLKAKHKKLLSDFYAEPPKSGLKNEYSIIDSVGARAQAYFVDNYIDVMRCEVDYALLFVKFAKDGLLSLSNIVSFSRYDDFLGTSPIYDCVRAAQGNQKLLQSLDANKLKLQQKEELRAANKAQESN